MGLVSGEPGREEIALPGGGGGFEPFELRHNGVERLRTFHARIGGEALPRRKETKEVACGNRLDLGTQPLDGRMMNAREQPPLAPFVRRRSRREAAAQRKAFAFERRKRC